jgi:hypothetical protein
MGDKLLAREAWDDPGHATKEPLPVITAHRPVPDDDPFVETAPLAGPIGPWADASAS